MAPGCVPIGEEAEVQSCSALQEETRVPNYLVSAHSATLKPAHKVTASQSHFLLDIYVSVIKGRETTLVAHCF